MIEQGGSLINSKIGMVFILERAHSGQMVSTTRKVLWLLCWAVMRRKIFLHSVASVVGLARSLRVFAAACFLAVSPLTALAAEKDATILVRQTLPTFTITLQSNPTTGYSWFLESFDETLLEAVLHRYLPPEDAAAGAPGKEVWTFRARHGAFVVPRTSRIVFRYLRPWNAAETPGENVFTIVFVP